MFPPPSAVRVHRLAISAAFFSAAAVLLTSAKVTMIARLLPLRVGRRSSRGRVSLPVDAPVRSKYTPTSAKCRSSVEDVMQRIALQMKVVIDERRG